MWSNSVYNIKTLESFVYIFYIQYNCILYNSTGRFFFLQYKLVEQVKKSVSAIRQKTLIFKIMKTSLKILCIVAFQVILSCFKNFYIFLLENKSIKN